MVYVLILCAYMVSSGANMGCESNLSFASLQDCRKWQQEPSIAYLLNHTFPLDDPRPEVQFRKQAFCVKRERLPGETTPNLND